MCSILLRKGLGGKSLHAKVATAQAPVTTLNPKKQPGKSAPFAAVPLLPHPHVDPHRRPGEAELLAQPPLQEPAVAGLQEPAW